MHLPTRGLCVYVFKIRFFLQSCQEWTILRICTGCGSFQLQKQRGGQKAQHREKETLEEKVQNSFG